MDLTTTFQQTANDVLTWVGFGTLVGLLAKAIMPGRDPGGALTTLIMGILGTVLGCGTLMYFTGGKTVTPISLMGFLVATAGAFVLLAFYRLLLGRRRFVDDGMLGMAPAPMGRFWGFGSRSRRRAVTVDDSP